MPESLSVVVCTLNGARGLDRLLPALAKQTIADELEIIVVDDGSSDDSAAVAARHGVTVVRHETNRGLSAARNTGIAAAGGSVIAFLDDDCDPHRDWAERLLGAYGSGVAGVGGPVVVGGPAGYPIRYTERHNPLRPVELTSAEGATPPRRLYDYLARQWRVEVLDSTRDVYSLLGANMSFRRELLVDLGGFDERFRFGADELDLCRRIHRAGGANRLVVDPTVLVVHHFEPSLRDTLRRSTMYGRGSARLAHKWRSRMPVVFPGPVVVAALLALSRARPAMLLVALLAPHLLYPRSYRPDMRAPEVVGDPYVQLVQETCEMVGFVQGLWLFRSVRRPS